MRQGKAFYSFISHIDQIEFLSCLLPSLRSWMELDGGMADRAGGYEKILRLLQFYGP